jgi:hypothetical protein
VADVASGRNQEERLDVAGLQVGWNLLGSVVRAVEEEEGLGSLQAWAIAPNQTCFVITWSGAGSMVQGTEAT